MLSPNSFFVFLFFGGEPTTRRGISKMAGRFLPPASISTVTSQPAIFPPFFEHRYHIVYSKTKSVAKLRNPASCRSRNPDRDGVRTRPGTPSRWDLPARSGWDPPLLLSSGFSMPSCASRPDDFQTGSGPVKPFASNRNGFAKSSDVRTRSWRPCGFNLFGLRRREKSPSNL